MEALMDAMRSDWEAVVRLAPRVTAAFVVLAVLYVAGRVVGHVLERILKRRRSSFAHVGFFRRLVVTLFVTVALVIGLSLVGLEGVAAGLVTSGGLMAVVVAFAFRGIGENLLSGLFLAFSCPFEVGNYIASGEFEGEVTSVELRFTHIRTADGRDVYVPNAQVFNMPLVNYTRDGLRRFDCRLGIDYADDAGRALATMTERISAVPGVLPDPKPFGRVRELSAQTVELSVLYWVDVFTAGRGVLAIQSDCNEAVRAAIVSAGFTVSSGVSTAVDLRSPAPLQITTGS